jgi:adenylyl cyclase-associated protein
MALEGAIKDLVSRLEAVTARLESVEGQLGGGAAGAAAPAAAAGAAVESSAAGQAYEDLVAEHFAPWYAVTQKLAGENLKVQMDAFQELVGKVLAVINVAAASKKPDMPTLQEIANSLVVTLKQVKELRESNRRDAQWNHLSTLSEGCAFANFLFVEPTPAPFVKETLASGQFWSNKILVANKGKNEDEVAFANGFTGFLNALHDYIRKHHTTGLSWNPRGGDAKAASAGASAAPAPGPPPPPAPSAATMNKATGADQPKKKAGPVMSDVLKQLNQGGAVTSGLRKVKREEKTKYRKDRVSVVKAMPKKKAPAKKWGGGGSKTTYPPKGPVLEGKKWVVEYHEDNKNIVIEENTRSETVYIYKCNNSVIHIKGEKITSGRLWWWCLFVCLFVFVIFSLCLFHFHCFSVSSFVSSSVRLCVVCVDLVPCLMMMVFSSAFFCRGCVLSLSLAFSLPG